MSNSATANRELPLADDPLACCVPLAREPISVELAAGVVPMLKAIADPARLRLLSLVLSHQGAEACVCDLTAPVGLSQPTVSHHLKILVEAGLLERTQRGRWAYYRVVPGALEALARSFTRGAGRGHRSEC